MWCYYLVITTSVGNEVCGTGTGTAGEDPGGADGAPCKCVGSEAEGTPAG